MLYTGCNNLSMLGLKLIHVSKRDPEVMLAVFVNQVPPMSDGLIVTHINCPVDHKGQPIPHLMKVEGILILFLSRFVLCTEDSIVNAAPCVNFSTIWKLKWTYICGFKNRFVAYYRSKRFLVMPSSCQKTNRIYSNAFLAETWLSAPIVYRSGSLEQVDPSYPYMMAAAVFYEWVCGFACGSAWYRTKRNKHAHMK